MIKKEIPQNVWSNRELIYELIGITRKYECSILIEMGEKTVNAKSLLGLFTLAQKNKNDKYYIIVQGKDENQAFNAIESLMLDREI